MSELICKRVFFLISKLHILEVFKEQNPCMRKVVWSCWQYTDFPGKVQADAELGTKRMLIQTSSWGSCADPAQCSGCNQAENMDLDFAKPLGGSGEVMVGGSFLGWRVPHFCRGEKGGKCPLRNSCAAVVLQLQCFLSVSGVLWEPQCCQNLWEEKGWVWYLVV